MVTVQYNPLVPEMRSNPHPFLRQLREEDPVHYSDVMDAWVLTRYADVFDVLKSPHFSADRRKARNRFAEMILSVQQQGPLGMATTMLSSDPPEHTRLRNLASKAFTARAIEEMRPHIQEIVTELLDSVDDPARFDLIGDLAYPLPVIVIAEMLGVPPEERDQFKRWSDDIVGTLGGMFAAPEVLERARAAAIELAEYFRGVIAERRKAPKDDLLSALIAAEERGDVLSEAELLATCILLLVAGNETTTNLIGNGMLALLSHPDQLAKLTADFSLIEPAVEELLRYDGPVSNTARVAMGETEIGGKTITEGQLVLVVLAAANRDPAQFPDPDALDITRQDNRHLAFGFGIHYCLGAPLARLEAQIAFEALLRRWPRPQLATEVVEWGPSFILRGPRSLPLSLAASA